MPWPSDLDAANLGGHPGRRPILLVCLAVFGLMTGQQMVNPILPPLARELGFSEFALGIVWTVGASGVVLASAFWSRRSMTWGHRPVLLISLTGAMVGLLAFAIVAQVGLAGVLAGPLLFALIRLSRGVVLAGLTVFAFAHPGIRRTPAAAPVMTEGQVAR